MKDDEHTLGRMERIKLEDGAANGAATEMERTGSTATPVTGDAGSQSPPSSMEDTKPSLGDSVGTPGSSKAPSLSRKASRKVASREPQLFGEWPDATRDACEHFQVIPDCLYGSKNMGATDNDAFDCDCRDEWQDGENIACGEDSDCINRATKVECTASGGNCTEGCQNQRFQKRQYANVSVIKTEKKGFGLRTDSDLRPNDFIFEYIGEVINEPTFRRRMLQYDQEGIKHFYFMSLSKSEFVDATKKGNLGRFCNHSCEPNCYVDKWVVGDKLRMGIFALRSVRAGEELVFNYNVDRYGAEPQPCYCGEPNCVGFIGGKTQTERATKLPIATVEALGIDAGDGWDTTLLKKPRKKRPDETDEEYVNSIQPRGLDDEDARKVMAALMQCKEKWIAVKLLERIQRCHDERVIHIVMRMHAYQILKTVLNTFIEDDNVVLQILEILEKLPRLTRNKIQDSKIEAAVEGLVKSEHEDVASMSKTLLEEWSKLEMAYRIRRRKVDPNAPSQPTRDDRRGGYLREEEQARQETKPASPQTIEAPRGPRNSVPQRNTAFFSTPRPRRPPFSGPLPRGWFATKDASGSTYYYDKQGTTTWKRPTQPAAETPKGPSKAMQEQAAIQSIIDRVTKEKPAKQSTPQPTPSAESSTPESRSEKWRALPADKQMKIYENTIFPIVKQVVDKFRHKLPKDELKRLGKEIAKKLVSSDFKHKRVSDPTAALSDKQAHKMRKVVKDFLDRAVEKYHEHQKRKTDKGGDGQPSTAADGNKSQAQADSAVDLSTESPLGKASPGADNGDLSLSDAGGADDSPSSTDRKRKRESEMADADGAVRPDGSEVKRLREGEGAEPSPPPPPPPPPQSAMEDVVTEEQTALREQEEALMRENEEAQRLEDEAVHTKTLEDTTREIQGDMAAMAREAEAHSNTKEDHDGSVNEHGEPRKQEVLSH